MPKPIHCIKDAELRVFVQHQFQARRVAFTAEEVVFSWPEGESIVDMIPCHEILGGSKARREDWANPEDKEDIEFWDTTEKRKKRISKFLFNIDHTPREFKITTAPEGYNSGREYIVQADTEEDCDEWISHLEETYMAAVKKFRKKNRRKMFQARLSAWFRSIKVQFFIAMMIMGNFIQEVMHLQQLQQLLDSYHATDSS